MLCCSCNSSRRTKLHQADAAVWVLAPRCCKESQRSICSRCSSVALCAAAAVSVIQATPRQPRNIDSSIICLLRSLEPNLQLQTCVDKRKRTGAQDRHSARLHAHCTAATLRHSPSLSFERRADSWARNAAARERR